MKRANLVPLMAAATLVTAVACDNAGADRAIGLSATGLVTGAVYFDANGSGTRDADDVPFAGARVRLLSPASRDTLLRTTTGADGRFRFTGVPVGSYAIVLDSASAGDSARVIGVDVSTVTLLPDDSVEVSGAIGFPTRTADEIRTRPLGERVFVTGVALHARETFSDTLLHIVDTSGAIRAVRVRPSLVPAQAGDSVRLRGRIGQRLGQRALDDVTVFVIGPTFVPTLTTVTTAVAATAQAGALDASLVRVLDAAIIDTATVAGHFTMTVNDASGPLTVRLDRAADVTFRAPLPAGLYVPANRFDIVGVLVPTGTGTFVLRPRSSLDLTER